MRRMLGRALEISPPDPSRATALAAAAERAREMMSRKPLDGAEHVIIGGRQEGKTYLAEKWLAETPPGDRRVLVTRDTRYAQLINERIPKGVDAEAISFRTLLRPGAKAEASTEYGFDETLSILTHLFKLHEPPRLITIEVAAEWQIDEAPGAPT